MCSNQIISEGCRLLSAKNCPSDRAQSNLKALAEQIVTILFCLQDPSLNENQRRKLWRIFERKLRYYIGLRYCLSYRKTEKN